MYGALSYLLDGSIVAYPKRMSNKNIVEKFKLGFELKKAGENGVFPSAQLGKTI